MKIKNSNWIMAIMLLFQVICMLYFANAKQGFFVDELWTYGLANSYYHPNVYSNGVLDNGWVSSDYFREYIEVSQDERFQYGSVVYNQMADIHPPLYYMVLHTVCSMFPDSFSKWYGLLPNIIYFILANATLYCLSKKVFGNSWLALLPPLIYGFSAGAISNVMFIRMYTMFTIWVLLSLTIHVRWILDGKQTFKSMVGLVAVSYLGYMTHYYFFLFAFLVSAWYVLYLLLKRQWKTMAEYCVTMFASLLLVAFTFPTAFKMIFLGDRGKVAAHNLLDISTFVANVKQYCGIVGRELFANIHFILLLISFVILIVSFLNKFVVKVCLNRDENGVIKICVDKPTDIKQEIYLMPINFAILFLAVTTVCYFLVVAKIAPYRVDRYVFGIYPVIVLLSVLFFRWLLKICGLKKTETILCILALFTVITLKGIFGGHVQYLYPEGKRNLEISKQFKGLDCIYVTKDFYKPAGNILELENTARIHMVVPWALDAVTDILKESGQSVVVYLDEELQQDVTMQQICDMTQYKRYEKMFQSRSFAYKLYEE